MKINEQHTQVPHMNLAKDGLTFNDPYVYACIKKYMNNQTREAFPCIATIVKVSGFHRETVMESIQRLHNAGYITIIKEKGKSNCYKFAEHKKFEILSYDFFDNQLLTPKEKAYYVLLQPFMYLDEQTKTGRLTYSIKDIADITGLSYNTLRKYEKSLINKGALAMVEIQKRNPITNLPEFARFYDLNTFANAIAVKVIQHDEELDDLQSKYDDLAQKYEEVSKQLEILLREQFKVVESEIVL